MKLWILFYNGWIHFRKKTASCCDALPAYRIARILSLLFFIFIFLKLSWFFSPQQSIALPFTTWNHSTDGVTSNRAHPHFHSAFWSAHFPVVLKQWACLLLLPLDTSLSLPRDHHLQLLKKQETNSCYLFGVLTFWVTKIDHFEIEKFLRCYWDFRSATAEESFSLILLYSCLCLYYSHTICIEYFTKKYSYLLSVFCLVTNVNELSGNAWIQI